MLSVPTALTIAGSDSGAGAGIQADLKTFSALGVYGTTAITAITAQNTRGVLRAYPLPPDVVADQIDAIAGDFEIAATKTGMLPTVEIVEVVAAKVREHGLPNLVVDPVMEAKGGATLMGESAAKALVRSLFPLALVVTPNLPEAEALLGRRLTSEDDYRQACRDLAALGPRYVVLKGGHRAGDPIDLLFDGTNFRAYTGPRLETPHTHGTGCTYASAIAAYIAHGRDVPTAVGLAKAFVARAIRCGLPQGHGRGPVWQFGGMEGLEKG
ncbi:MAG: bifunctional hydroxymethylpyrimidine kinase/phosphomethylpyrimidine kinase [Bacteroidetes bacterium]|nr:bifunctional hydroxymethylpyrimidine kinase/phosphomethylpyrimidine kinase [Bacteroidota bacterium]